MHYWKTISIVVPLLLPAGAANAQVRQAQAHPITSQVKDGGTYHLATSTWTRGVQGVALAGPEVIYDNTCTTGYYFGLTDGDKVFDSGRIPSTSSPNQAGSSLTGLYDNYEVNGFQMGYCSFEPSSTNIDVSFVDCYAACDGGGVLPVPLALFNIVNAPAGTPSGAQGCWLVTLDLANTPLTFDLGGDCNGTYNNTPSSDSFGWSWTQTIPTTGSNAGPIMAGDPIGLHPQSGQSCGGVGGGTTFIGSSAGPGTGIGILDQMEIGDGPTAPGCYWFGGYSAANPYAAFYMQLRGADGGASCVNYQGFTACPLGSANLSLQGPDLHIANIGSSGLDGVAIDMGSGTDEIHLGLNPMVAAAHPGAVFVLENQAGSGQTDSLTFVETGGEWLCTPDLSQLGSATYTLDLFLQGQLVYTQSGMTGPALAAGGTAEHYDEVVQYPDGTVLKKGCTIITTSVATVPGVGPIASDMFTISSEHVVIPSLNIQTVSLRAQNLTTDIVLSSLFEPTNPGSPYCFGDGTGSACPCGNNGTIGRGCANSATGGAQLTAQGEPGISGIDTLLFSVSGVNGIKPGLLLRGNNQIGGGLGNPVGDGLICTGGNSMRSQVVLTDLNGNALFADWFGNRFRTVANVGTPTNFQYWYRDPMGPCGSGFNFSNAWTVTYTP